MRRFWATLDMVGADCWDMRVTKATASRRPPQATKRKLKATKTRSILFAMVAALDGLFEGVVDRECQLQVLCLWKDCEAAQPATKGS